MIAYNGVPQQVTDADDSIEGWIRTLDVTTGNRQRSLGAVVVNEPIGGSPLALKTYAGPVSNDQLTIDLQQAIGANEPLRTGKYAKTLTFTLSTASP